MISPSHHPPRLINIFSRQKTGDESGVAPKQQENYFQKRENQVYILITRTNFERYIRY